MRRYFAVVDKEPDSAFGMWFPDVPGCFSAADSEDDLLPNAIEALTMHLEDQVAPDARGVGAIAQDPDVAAALEAGAFLLAVPLMSADTRQVRVNISLDKGTLNAIDAAAALRKMTRSAFLVEAARNEIEERRSA